MKDIKVQYGLISKEISSYPQIKVENITLPYGYTRGSRSNDLAFLTLSEPIPKNGDVKYAKINYHHDLLGSHKVWVYGWKGAHFEKPDLKSMIKVKMTTYYSDRCLNPDYAEQRWRKLIKPNMKILCATGNSRQLCDGPTGGAVTLPNGKLAGIVTSLCYNSIDVNRFINIYFFKRFIQNSLKSIDNSR
ncbi:Serine protease 55 [Blomia tropicalis]|nr:Serine protease 55 [Blomia tropicalis]